MIAAGPGLPLAGPPARGGAPAGRPAADTMGFLALVAGALDSAGGTPPPAMPVPGRPAQRPDPQLWALLPGGMPAEPALPEAEGDSLEAAGGPSPEAASILLPAPPEPAPAPPAAAPIPAMAVPAQAMAVPVEAPAPAQPPAAEEAEGSPAVPATAITPDSVATGPVPAPVPAAGAIAASAPPPAPAATQRPDAATAPGTPEARAPGPAMAARPPREGREPAGMMQPEGGTAAPQPPLTQDAAPAIRPEPTATAAPASAPAEAASHPAPRPAELPAHPAPRLVAEAGHQIALRVARATEQRIETISVDLRPPELGRVEVRLSFRDGAVHQVVVSADRPETFQSFAQDRGLIEQQLQRAGIELGMGGLELRHGGSGGRDAEAGAEPARPEGATAEAEPEAEIAAPVQHRGRALDSLVDIIA
jgi:hypothetical protein